MAESTSPLPPPDHPAQLFLADRDAPCPGCGYNLRGIQEPVCPECGRHVELTISRPGRSRGYLLFVLLALGWVLTAGSMNAVRTWKTAQLEATPRAQTLMTFANMVASGPGGVSGAGGTGVAGRPGRVTTTTSTWTSSGTVVTINSGGSLRFSTRAAPLARAGPVWSNVSQQTWINLGWWSSLGLLALVMLLIAIFRRRRFAGDVPPRRIVATACILFALYASYHAVMFSREMMF